MNEDPIEVQNPKGPLRFGDREHDIAFAGFGVDGLLDTVDSHGNTFAFRGHYGGIIGNGQLGKRAISMTSQTESGSRFLFFPHPGISIIKIIGVVRRKKSLWILFSYIASLFFN